MDDAQELREILKRLGWSDRVAGEKLDVSARTVRYWKANTPPRVAVFALRYLESYIATGAGNG